MVTRGATVLVDLHTSQGTLLVCTALFSGVRLRLTNICTDCPTQFLAEL